MLTTSRTMAEVVEPLRPKSRPIVRIGIFLISHSTLLSVVCFAAGVLALLLLPVLAKKTYISENALMPGSASPMLSTKDVLEANKLITDLTKSSSKEARSGMEIPSILRKHMAYLGAEVSYHKFQPTSNKFHPLHFFSSPNIGIVHENQSSVSYNVNVVAIIRAPQGDGKEAIVIVSPYNSMRVTNAEALLLGIASSVFSLLSRVTWLAKDIIWVAADSTHGEYDSVAAWLRDYHSPNFRDVVSETFRRAGTMGAALVIKVSDKSVEVDTLSIYAEASNGQMPNLDLINIVNYLAVHGQGFRVKVDKFSSLLNSQFLKAMGQIFETIGKLAKSLNPQWKFGIPATDYIDGAVTLASSLYNQALGVPTGSHGAFRDYQIDAITMEISTKVSFSNKARQKEFLLRSGRLVEGIVRSVNNLLEKFHQSFFLYLLTSPGKFVSVGVYMVAFGLIVAPLPIVAASLYINAHKESSPSGKVKDTSVETFKSWKWLSAVRTMFVVHLWGAVVMLLPYFICQLPDYSQTSRVLYLLPGFHKTEKEDWVLLKSATISAATIGLCLMSVINFSTAEIGALLIVPMCLLASPLRFELKAACNLMLFFIGCPPIAYMIVKGLYGGFGNVDAAGEFWSWMETLWVWNSSTYIYICMVHLPCWLLCARILLH
ncbi:glycosylphosphatidylinositol anchor attachment 1 protein-like isoform X1 [Impatiens glandulifera]|uniref:glycosylphosphatidylinositol anchor attachment 1 protein-like isoform X1 n=1 Tax=Impatiens glandulifera TaxID=253017 RepID=UPI001FB08D25|nr:glycosylphosphatidylinositol anchor attachment 1 protein-like isoform X1 [Impatiens glandulifera]